MYKYLITFCLTLLCLNFSITAQIKLIAESKPFDEPSGDCGIVQMKNGNTVFFSYNKKDGISIRIYDKDHVEKATNNFSVAEDLKKENFKTVFEVNNDAVIFISCFSEGMPALMRFIVDGNTGMKKEEKKIIQIEGKGGIPDEQATAFIIKNDPVSGNYAVSAINLRENDDNKRIQVILYNTSNTELKKTWLLTNDDKDYKFFIVMNMAIVNANQVKVFLYNGKEKYFSNTKPGRFVMASVNVKNETPAYTTISLPEGIKFDKCLTDYSQALNKLFVIVTEPVHSPDAVLQYYIKIDPATDKAEVKNFTSISEAMTAKFNERYSTRGNYTGTMQEFSTNADGSFTAVYEDRFNYNLQVISTGGGFGNGTKSSSYSTSYWGKIMVATYNPEGQKLSEYIVPKLYISTGSPYKDLLFVNNGKNAYMCINDTRRNNNVVKDKFAEVSGIADCDAFYFKLQGTDNFPARDYVFGDQDKSRLLIANRYVDYNKAENTLATMKLTIASGKPKQCNIVWLQPQ